MLSGATAHMVPSGYRGSPWVSGSTGSPILTGREFGSVGTVQDLIVGEFLDRVYFDQGNFRAVNAFHVSLFGGKANTQGRNLISDPPSPNPPPTRYWVGSL